MKTFQMIWLSCLILLISCQKENQECIQQNSTRIDSTYYINEIFEQSFIEKPYIIDTTRLVQAMDSMVHPVYRIDTILLSSEERCPVNACAICTGGAVYFYVLLENTTISVAANDTLHYPGCTSNYLSGIGLSYPAVKVDSVELRLLRVLPQPGDEPIHYELGYLPLEEYRVSFRLQNIQ